MRYTLENILDEANHLTTLQEQGFEATLKDTDSMADDHSICELLAFLRDDDCKTFSYTHSQ